MGLIEDIESEVGPLGEAERQMVERELDLMAAFAAGLVGRIPADASKGERQAAITELLYEDAELFAVFSQMMDFSRSNPGSPLGSVHRLTQELKSHDEAP